MSNIVQYMYWKWDGVLPPEFCNAALEHIDWATAEAGVVNAKNPVSNPKVRRTDVIWQDSMKPLGCIARTYTEVANQAAGWGFALSGQEQTQIGRYKSTDQGFYDWHVDTFPPNNGIQRKLTCVMLLNDSADFEGGVLQLKHLEEEVTFAKQGSIIVFPSFIEHKVTPVTKGVRYTAVTWAEGPAFK